MMYATITTALEVDAIASREGTSTEYKFRTTIKILFRLRSVRGVV
jgi:hypothetical protein